MKIETELGTIYVTFQHLRVDPQALKQMTKSQAREARDLTLCIIQKDGIELGCGFSRTHPNDRYNKEEGRKTALAIALGGRFIKPTLDEYLHNPDARGHRDYSNSTLNRGFRRMVWQGYFARKSRCGGGSICQSGVPVVGQFGFNLDNCGGDR